MLASSPATVVDEMLAPGLRYTEEASRRVQGNSVRHCYLWQESEESPVSELEVYSFEQRFGAVAVAAEGIGGVETPPPFRRRGYVRQLLTRATAGMAQRVNVGFVSDGINGLYEKFGYHACLTDGYLSLKIRNLEPLLKEGEGLAGQGSIHDLTPADLPGMIELYNVTHAQRPWTLVRQDDWNRLKPVQTWKPGSTAVILADGEKVAAYAIFREHFFGWSNDSLAVDEMAARDLESARLLLAELAWRCWQLRLSEFVIYEPVDSPVGFAARRLGCEYHQRYRTTGGMMGAIFQRASLIAGLEAELRRRLSGAHLKDAHEFAFPALQRGEIISDDQVLLRLLLGDWSMNDALTAGVILPPHFAALCAAWFPGGGSQMLPIPFAHKLDRY